MADDQKAKAPKGPFPQLSKRGWEVPNPKPAALSLHFTTPATTKDLVTRLLEEQRVKRMLLDSYNVEETDDEAEDFGEEEFDGLTPSQWEKEAEALPIGEVRARMISYLQNSEPGKLQVLVQKFKRIFRPEDLKRLALQAARSKKVEVPPLAPKPKPGEPSDK